VLSLTCVRYPERVYTLIGSHYPQGAMQADSLAPCAAVRCRLVILLARPMQTPTKETTLYHSR